MVSAPSHIDSYRSGTEVRTKAGMRPRVGSGYGVGNRASASGPGRRNSPDKASALRGEGVPDTTPRCVIATATDSARGDPNANDDEPGADDADEDFGPRRRRLSAKQYE